MESSLLYSDQASIHNCPECLIFSTHYCKHNLIDPSEILGLLDQRWSFTVCPPRYMRMGDTLTCFCCSKQKQCISNWLLNSACSGFFVPSLLFYLVHDANFCSTGGSLVISYCCLGTELLHLCSVMCQSPS